MSEYIMDPGARLEVGPGGKPYESLGGRPAVNRGLGACCAGCSATAGALGGANKGNLEAKKLPVTTKNVTASVYYPPAKPGGGLGGLMRGKLPYIIGGAALLGVGAIVVMRRRKRP